MAQIQTARLALEYDTFGDEIDRPLLLVMGLGAQMTAWNEGFCKLLAEHGHFVIRFDNRDCGLSQKFAELGVPNIHAVREAVDKGEQVDVPYLLTDMAEDAFSLLDALAIERTHVCGASMGGMIVQTMAITNAARLLSMTSIMSATGNRDIEISEPEAFEALMSPPGNTREESIERSLRVGEVIGSQPEYLDPVEERYARAAAAYDRSFYPQGIARQMSAISVADDRRPALQGIKVPALVIHGTEDRLVRFECGEDTRDAMTDAEMLAVSGMGHDMPRYFWQNIIKHISLRTLHAGRFPRD